MAVAKKPFQNVIYKILKFIKISPKTGVEELETLRGKADYCWGFSKIEVESFMSLLFYYEII